MYCICVHVQDIVYARGGVQGGDLCKFKQLLLETTLQQGFHGNRLIIEKLVCDELAEHVGQRDRR